MIIKTRAMVPMEKEVEVTFPAFFSSKDGNTSYKFFSEKEYVRVETYDLIGLYSVQVSKDGFNVEYIFGSNLVPICEDFFEDSLAIAQAEIAKVLEKEEVCHE